MAKKQKLIALADHQKAVADPELRLELITPRIVGYWGAYVELEAHPEVEAGHRGYYRGMVDNVARLLGSLGVEAVGGDAIQTATSRIALGIPAELAVSGRIERLYRAHYLREHDHLRYEAERLWVVLEARSEELAGCTFQEVLA